MCHVTIICMRGFFIFQMGAYFSFKKLNINNKIIVHPQMLTVKTDSIGKKYLNDIFIPL